MKVLVAHPAQQHSYRLATALKKAGMLDKYATTVYYRRGSLTALVAKFLKGKFKTKAEERHCEALTNAEVIQFCEGEGLLKLVALNTSYFKKNYNQIKYHTADRFARKVARYAIKHNVDAVVTYDDCSPILFEILKDKAPNILRIMDMSAANILYMRSIYERDMELAPAFAERLRKERSICWDPIITDRARREIDATQKFLVPSEFVAKSLDFSGVQPEQVHRCPYGVDVSQFSMKEFKDDLIIRTRPIRFIYVGGVKELKEISYLLDAFMEIPEESANLTVVGQYDLENTDIYPYKERIVFTGEVHHTEIPELLKAADVFIFPSLGDSYTLSAMEAAICGLPVIVTENTGLQDAIIDGKNGFVIPINSKDALIDRIQFFVDHPDRIEPMGRAAKEIAEKNNWDVYYDDNSKIGRNLCGIQPTIVSYTIKEYKDKPWKTRPIHFIYVGGVKELKGVSYLFDAFMEIPNEIATLTVIGNYNVTDKDTERYQGRIRFTGNILHSAVTYELQSADVFVFASLGEGLSLSTLEAAACGLPLIVTENSGVNDGMDGTEGFVIPIQSKEAIKDKVIWFSEHPENIKQMGEAARGFALRFSWEAYYERIGTVFRSL